MDINEIKKLISLTGGKYIIIDNDKPQFILMTFDDFRGMVEADKNNPSRVDLPRAVKIESENKKQDANISAGNVFNENEEIPVDLLDIKEDRLGEVRIEDLPF
ncbi:MAG: hypothetical protein US76_01355 [Parcubacteria group bacterium GW2011_GWA2_38_13b]|nr:MAG: hypothetical protein US76_01355 [Parcubacteria group bacterium GW2011_GWA2_38_13b]